MPRINPVPQMRIREKVDACMATLDYAGVERTLNYWLMEAQSGNDLRGELMIRNEFIGHFRKTGEQKKAEIHAADALSLIVSKKLGFMRRGAKVDNAINEAFSQLVKEGVITDTDGSLSANLNS